MKKKTAKRNNPDAMARALRTAADESGIPSDVQGSYTGTGLQDERPVQDADDL